MAGDAAWSSTGVPPGNNVTDPVMKETDGDGVGTDVGLLIVEVTDGEGVGGEGDVVGTCVGEYVGIGVAGAFVEGVGA